MQGQVFLVGGAVRDELLGLAVTDRDWVVVGSNPEAMLAAGYRQVDPDFPVFLHPQTGEEYALARRETKVAGGYRGFAIDASPEVTLEQDLARRDFTVNALARDQGGKLIDPFNGLADLQDERLRHVTPAFAEDPLRILRAARFAAKLGFRLAHGTNTLMRDMVEKGAISELLPQRIGQETRRALATELPWRYFEVLQGCGALTELAPGLAGQLGPGVHQLDAQRAPLQALRGVTKAGQDVDVRFAALLLESGDPPGVFHVGRQAEELLQAARTAWSMLGDGARPATREVYGLLNRLRAWHPHGGFERVLSVLNAQPGGLERSERLARARDAAMAVAADRLKSQGLSGAELGMALAEARTRAIAGVWDAPGAAL